MASNRRASRLKYSRTRSSELMVEHLSERREREVVEQAGESWSGRGQVDVVRHPRFPVERHARVIRIELPRVQIEDRRAAVSLRIADVRAREPVRIDPEVGAAARRN